ncbi:hypothetical protein WA026_020059 [Henosepilachna vigintioctopunctata]|uniref:Dynein intermediate chain 2, axonemal n=1 Tax=Henosepilachna vigintioctopunctata TaxID=420089 RepID=A0AAW1U1Y7_9CUCU
MEVQYVYQKKRAEFGRQCLFSDKGPELIDNFPPDRSVLREYILRDPVSRGQQGAPQFACHELNTTRAEYTNGLMSHVEGGWPKDVNLADEEQTKRYRRKVEKEENYAHTLMGLCKNMESCVLQNNAINIYQQYFSDVEPTPLVEKSSARTVNVFQDQVTPTRPITHISWSPDGQTKIANSHCNMVFQALIDSESTYSFIWEIENPNKPLHIFKPEQPIVCLEYHPKDPHSLVSGHLNGQVGVWDTRKGYEPTGMSVMESSFREPVSRVCWINTKSGTDFFSGSTDGQVKWWDARNLSEPTETLILHAAKDDEQSLSSASGVSCLEYEPTIPTRFMVGTELGYVISCNRKGKTAIEKMTARYNAHLGPVLACERNPNFIKNFLTIGDWTARIWSEDCRESSIMWTSYHKALLTDGSWSSTRLSSFFTTRSDGILDVWDILQQQKEASMSVKVCDEPLTRIRTHDSGKMVAIGNQKGTVYLVELSDNLATCNRNDKMLLTAMFEREAKREKILEARNREIRLKAKTKVSGPGHEEEPEKVEHEGIDEEEVEKDPYKDEFIQAAEDDFFNIINKELQKDLPLPEEEPIEVPPEPEPEPIVVEPPPRRKKKGKGKKGKKGKKK